MDAFIGHFDPFDPLETEQQLDEVHRRGRRHRLDDGPAGLLDVLAEEGALDRQLGRVHRHTLIGPRILLPSLSKEREGKGSREPPLGGHAVRRDFGILPEVAPAVPQ